MEVEKKENINLNPDVRQLMNDLKYNDYPIFLVGSSSFKSNLYTSDYDFLSPVLKSKNTYADILKILKKVINEKNHFIEFKLQTKKGEKLKYYNINEFNEKEFKKYYSNVDFMKIDLVSLLENDYKEASSIYKVVSKVPADPIIFKDIKDNLLSDIKKYRKEGKYYKSLKRLFSYILTKYTNEQNLSIEDKKTINKLLSIFNGKLGAKYELLNNVNALLLLLNSTGDNLLIKNIKDRLKFMVDSSNIENIIKKMDSLENNINEQAKKYDYLFNDVI